MAQRSSTHRGRGAACLSAGAALLGAALLSACSTNVGELPFPSVHDMPRARTNTTLSDAEQQKAQQDLVTARDSTEARAQQNAQSSAGAGSQPSNTGAAAAKGATAAAGGSAASRKGTEQQAGDSRSQ
jgi:hypothetical protein